MQAGSRPRRRPLLSAALIVRDESLFLPGCLESLAGIVDDVVVVDTGSRDGTPDIASGFGARVVHHPWRDDFAEARNVSLDLARGEWILYIDADERLVGTDRASVEALLSGADEVAFRLLFRPFVDMTPYREYRLWRNDPRIRFEGVIHEKVVPAIHRVGEEDGRPIGDADLMLVHLGYEGDQTRKHHRNLPLLRRQLEVEPENLFAWHHLARVLEALGEVEEAEQALAAAVERARALEWVDPLAVLSYADLIRLREARGADTEALLAEALEDFPDNCVLLLALVRQFIRRGDYEEAIAVLDGILGRDWSSPRPGEMAYHLRIVEEVPWAERALCCFRLGRYEEAAQAYEAAARAAPADASYPVKAKLARARAKKAAGSTRSP